MMSKMSKSDADIKLEGEVPIKKRKTQKFREEWLLEPEFSDWLRKDGKDEYRAVCNMCNKSLLAEKCVLTRHRVTTSHINNAKKFSCSSSKNTQQSIILPAFQNISQPNSKNHLIKMTTIKLAAFVAEHNIAAKTMNHLMDLLPQLCPDSKIAKKLKSTEIQPVINNCIGESERQTLVNDLIVQKFSILIDESTDIGVIIIVTVVVRYFDLKLGQVVSRFWDLIQLLVEENMMDQSSIDEKIFKMVIKSFQDYCIPLENIIGFGSDGANTMMNCRNYISSLFQDLCPGITILNCICHSLHLCANDATKKLPYACEKLARNIYNYFKNNSKSQSEFAELQQFAEVDVHRILRPAQTRWLSVYAVIDRILKHWDDLRRYFNSKGGTDSECQEIHTQLKKPEIKAYYCFLKRMLLKFKKVNTYFQSESVVITKLNQKMSALYIDLMMLIFPITYLRSVPIEMIDPTEERNHLKSIYLGVGVQKQLELIPEGQRKEIFRHTCKQFVIKACIGIRMRYPINDEVMKAISNLDPKMCVSKERLESLAPIFSLLPRLTPKTLNEQQELDDEWRSLLLHLPKYLDASQLRPDEFWHQVAQISEENKKVFQRLPSFMLGILSLPHSNAECERIFSKVNEIIREKRNELIITHDITGNLLTQQSMKRHGQDCINFKPDDEMLIKLM